MIIAKAAHQHHLVGFFKILGLGASVVHPVCFALLVPHIKGHHQGIVHHTFLNGMVLYQLTDNVEITPGLQPGLTKGCIGIGIIHRTDDGPNGDYNEDECKYVCLFHFCLKINVPGAYLRLWVVLQGGVWLPSL